jgi:alpha-N-arabinofuranosidase
MDAVQRVVVLPREEIGVINPYLHGHFAEHLGELVYPGISVPLDSDIPNTGGIRSDVVEALKPLGIPVLRWPGGCFADDYHWRDGIGPLDQRPMRINNHWGQAEEPNSFGTHEFMAFCKAIGAEPYFAGNLGSGTPHELRDWIEYCNFGGNSTLADERRTNGQADPFGIRFWGIGNENWGCGGSMSPEAYAEEFCRFRTFVNNYSGIHIDAIACGPNGADWAWTRRLLETLKSGHTGNRLKMMQGFAAHYYCGTAGTATEYTEQQWLELLAKAYAIDGIVSGHRAIMDEYDPERKIKLLMDEWGAWHPVEAGKPRGGLYQQNTIRDACVAALSLDVFHTYADRLYMANIAQLINVLQALLLVDGNQCIKTPTYHVFELYKAHQGGTSVRFLTGAETVSDGEGSADHCRRAYLDKRAFSLKAVHGSASVKDGVLTVTAVNTHPTEATEMDLDIHHFSLTEAEVITLAASDIHAHNTFAQPEVVTLSAPVAVTAKAGENLRISLPAGSVVRVQGKVG